MGIREFVRYVVLEIMAGRVSVVDAVYDYFVRNGGFGGVAELASTYNLTRNQLRNYVQRAIEKAGGLSKARIYVRLVVPIAKGIAKPVINGDAKCSLCGASVLAERAVHHILENHRDVLEEQVERVIEELKRLCRACRGGYRG